ncbi:MAG: hypothetical protein JWP72_4311, partial [Massilia sp.]|nr:hypothetical protein [Massilia sp.]
MGRRPDNGVRLPGHWPRDADAFLFS